MFDRIGGAYSHSSLLAGGLGGSEIELLQVAHGLTAKGYSVVVANGVESPREEEGVRYVPHAQAWQHVPTQALYLQRWSSPTTRLEIGADVRVVVRANDVYCAPYDVHREALSRGRATLVANTHWQADQFAFATDKVVIPPMLEPMPIVKKQRGLFVFASGAMKGFEETVALWCAMKGRQPAMRDCSLRIVSPGWGAPRALTMAERAAGIEAVGMPTPKAYRRWIAKAEGLFMVNTMPETFGCAAALAERAGTRTHILCVAGRGGLSESVKESYYINDNAAEFEQRFLIGLGAPLSSQTRPLLDLRPSALLPKWTEVLQRKPIQVVTPSTTIDPFLGDGLSLLRGALADGGSEFGTGLMLFSLATAIQARELVEIGRFQGFSTLALAMACRLQDLGWQEPARAEQRPDVDYRAVKPPPRVVSIDPVARPEAEALLAQADLWRYVVPLNVRSETVTPDRPIDLLFVDGDHSVAGLRADLQRFVPWVRPGGYFILHDYYGWFTPDGKNGSPIAQVIAEDLTDCDRLLIDTHYASLVIFRKTQRLTERWELPPQFEKMPARADGRPTVGLVLIAKGDEVNTVATRAIRSAQKAGVDCVTVVCDAQDAAADMARSLGAEVVIRPTPSHDWDKGIGWICGARNDALQIAEPRTDYLLIVDADDWFEGTIPSVLDHDAYDVTIHDGGLQYQRIQLFRSSLRWRYHGIIHETLQVQGSGPIGRLSTLTYRRGSSSYGAQEGDPAVKYSRHAQLARKWLLDHPDDARMQFYLARSLQDAGRPEEARVEYAKRLAMRQGWEEERSYSAYQIGLIQMASGQDPTSALLHAASLGVPKAEPFVALARWYRDDARTQFPVAMLFAQQAAAIPQPASALFTQPWIYQFEASAEVAICAYWLGMKHDALTRFDALLPKVPPERRAWCESQIAICRRDLAG